MYGLGAGLRTVCLRKSAIAVDGLGFFCLFWSGFRHSSPPLPTAVTGCTLGVGVEGPHPIFGVGSSKKYVSEKVGSVGGLYEGKFMTKWGTTLLLIGSYRQC